MELLRANIVQIGEEMAKDSMYPWYFVRGGQRLWVGLPGINHFQLTKELGVDRSAFNDAGTILAIPWETEIIWDLGGYSLNLRLPRDPEERKLTAILLRELSNGTKIQIQVSDMVQYYPKDNKLLKIFPFRF